MDSSFVECGLVGDFCEDTKLVVSCQGPIRLKVSCVVKFNGAELESRSQALLPK
jgi:hypothetical protein